MLLTLRASATALKTYGALEASLRVFLTLRSVIPVVLVKTYGNNYAWTWQS